MEKQIYIITGGPGFGKTKLIDELRRLGHLCSGEFARDLIESQQKSGGEILPWKNPRLFQEEVLKQRITFYESVPDGIRAFADRGIPDQLAFAHYRGFGSPEVLMQRAADFRYAPRVFITPPWAGIFENDAIRGESFDEAVRIHQVVIETYTRLDYQLIELPLGSVNQRADYILQTLNQYKTYEPT